MAAVDAVAQRAALEREFTLRLEAKPSARARYAELLPTLNQLYASREPLAIARAYVGELNYNIDLFRIANILDARTALVENNGMEAFREGVPGLLTTLRTFYAGYRPDVDLEVTRALLREYYAGVTAEFQAPAATDQLREAGGYAGLISTTFEGSLLARGDTLIQLLESDPEAFVDAVRSDPAFRFVRGLNAFSEARITNPYNEYATRINGLQRRYMEALLRFFPERRFYPDANGTLRVSYGKFEGFTDLNGDTTTYMTYLDGVLDKYIPADYEFDVPRKLRDLYAARDYGAYATADGRLPVCLLGSNHTTGGNSGSPALNGRGQLVGLNFDRTWQSTMSDVHYDPAICRNIMVDIRYVLFLIDKLGGAGHLVDEMTVLR